VSGNSAAPIRVLVLAIYPTVRAGLRAVVQSDPSFAIAGDVESVDALLSQLEALAPDVLLLDPGAESDALFDALEPMLNGDLLPPLVLIASDVSQVNDAIESGMQGFLLPDASADEITAALRAAVNGLTAIDNRAVRPLLERRPVETLPPAEGDHDALTPREREVLQLIAQGLPNKTIALELGISEHTVKFHVGSILAKLDASSRAEALARAARVGLIVL